MRRPRNPRKERLPRHRRALGELEAPSRRRSVVVEAWHVDVPPWYASREDYDAAMAAAVRALETQLEATMAEREVQGTMFDAEPGARAEDHFSSARPAAPADDGIGWRVPPRSVLFPKPTPDPANVRAWRRILAGK